MTDHDEISQLYAGFKDCLTKKDLRRACGYMHMIYTRISFHPSIISQITFEPLVQREFVRLITMYVREFPDDPVGYLLHMSYHRERGRLDIFRKTWRDTCANAVKGFHFQPGVAASVFDAERGAGFTALGGLRLGERKSARIEQIKSGLLDGDLQPSTPLEDKKSGRAVIVETFSGEPIGPDGVALNGTLGGFDMPTRYHFRYGINKDDLSETTAERHMPAGLNGMAFDDAANIFRRLNCFTPEQQFFEISDDLQDDPTVGSSPVGVKLQWPFGKDRNHLDGIGVIDLFLGWNNQVQTRGIVDGVTPSPPFPSRTFPGEAVDLRDAEFSVSYRTDDLDPKDFRPVAWLHGRTGTAAFSDEWDDLAAWAVTSDANDTSFSVDGAWHNATYRLPAHSSDWTFCGSNIGEMGAGMERYTYAPIQNVLRDNIGGNLCVSFVHGDELNTPEGDVDVSEMQLRYRSRSVLAPGQGVELIEYSNVGPGTPDALNNGVIGKLEDSFLARFDDGKPITFVWRLRTPQNIQSFKLHQCPLAPTKEVKIAVSMDGKVFSDMCAGALDDVPEDPALWGEFSQVRGLVRTIVLPQAEEAQFIRLEIHSAHREGVVGLDAFEVFGEETSFVPGPEPLTLSEYVENVKAGVTIFAQLVAENETGTYEGDVIEVARPTEPGPHIIEAGVVSRESGLAIFAARTIAMGSPSVLQIELIPDDGGEVIKAEVAIGQWQVPRDVRLCIRGLRDDVSYDGVCHALNENGRTKPHSFVCEK